MSLLRALGEIPWWLSAAAIWAAAASSRLLGTWCADPLLGAVLAGTAIAAGISAQSLFRSPGKDESTLWAAAAGLVMTLMPLLIRFLGINTASVSFLEEPLLSPVFVLGQVWLAAAVASAAAARAARGLARPTGAIARSAPVLAALAVPWGTGRFDSSVVLALAGAALTTAAAIQAGPWRHWRTHPLQARGLALSAVLALVLSARSPGLMRDVWTARLDKIYPGGRFLALVDDGVRVAGLYEFSNKDRVVLRDGILQGDDTAEMIAPLALKGQTPRMKGMLLVDPPTTISANVASAAGLDVSLQESSRAHAAALDALGGERWRSALRSPPPDKGLDGALVFLPRPLGRIQARRWALRAALRALRPRLTASACAVIVVPSGTPHAETDSVASAARDVFAFARTADVGRSVLIAACPDSIETDPFVLYGRIASGQAPTSLEESRSFAEILRWRPLSTGN